MASVGKRLVSAPVSEVTTSATSRPRPERASSRASVSRKRASACSIPVGELGVVLGRGIHEVEVQTAQERLVFAGRADQSWPGTGGTPARQGLAVSIGRAVLLQADAEKMVHLVLVQRPVTGCRGHHKLTDQLDLGLQVIICEIVIDGVIVGSGVGHPCNLPAAAMVA